ncbi:MAG: TetR/AcrR family transcriptional regulator [Bacillota bacterium]|nr:TetR/AcrR family transcriptional regulator [Bacillota bacterium]
MEAERRLEKETMILDAAERVFAARGYAATTVKGVALEAGVATGTVYLYFPSKEELFLALIDRGTRAVLEGIVEARQGKPDVIAKLAASLEGAVRAFSAHRDLARVALLQAPGALPACEERLAQLHRLFADYVAQDLEEAGAAGLIPPLDARVAAWAWVGSFAEILLAWVRGDVADLEEVLPGLVAYNLRGIGAPGLRESQRGQAARSAGPAERRSAGRDQPPAPGGFAAGER